MEGHDCYRWPFFFIGCALLHNSLANILCCICLLSQMICVFIWVEGTKAIEWGGGGGWSEWKEKSLLCVSLHFGRLRIFSVVCVLVFIRPEGNLRSEGGGDPPPCAFFFSSELCSAVELLLVAGLLPLSRNNRIDERHFWYTPAKRINRRQQQWSGDISSFSSYFFGFLFIFAAGSHQLVIVCLVFRLRLTLHPEKNPSTPPSRLNLIPTFLWMNY